MHLSLRGLLVAVLFGAGMVVGMSTADARSSVQKEVKAQLRAAAAQAIGEPSVRLSITEMRVSPTGILEKARLIKTLELSGRSRGYGRVSAQAVFRLRSGESVRGFVTARVKAEASILVAARRIRRGEVLTQADFTTKRASLSGLRADALRADSVVDGRIAARDMMRGSVVGSRAVTTPLLVRRGEPVSLMVTVGSVTVRADGTALRDGRMGDRITVRAQGKRVVSGTVAGVRKIEVHR